MRIWTAMLVGAALVTLAGAPRAQDDKPRETFEQFLARAKAQRDQQQRRLATDVEQLVQRLSNSERNGKEVDGERALKELIALGSEATPLLLPHLDPGSAASDADKLRAQRVAEALAKMGASPVTELLLVKLGTASELGVVNALRVLETVDDAARVRPKIRAVFDSAAGAPKRAALRTLFALGGADNDQLVSDVMLGDDQDLARLALIALADGRNTALVDQVDRLLADPRKASRVVPEALAYFRAVPQAAQEREIELLAALALDSTHLEVAQRVAILEALPELSAKLPADARKSLEHLGKARDRKVQDAALIALACFGDRGAKRDLLAEYDDRVKKNDRWAPAYADRAEVLYRVRDYDAAAKDYTQALVHSKNDATPRPDLYVGLARCYAWQGKLKEAHDWLERAPITYDELRKLRDEPAFAKLREHAKYGAIFGEK